MRSHDGIENVIKGLDAKLSEAIMHAMQNGPFLQEKVSASNFVADFYYYVEGHWL